LKQIDERVRRDLDKFVDGAVRERIANFKRDLLLWMVAAEIVRLGAFSTALQSQMLSRFDRETVGKLRLFLGSLSKVSAESIVYEKMVSVRNELERIAPIGIVEQVSALNEQCRDIIEGRA